MLLIPLLASGHASPRQAPRWKFSIALFVNRIYSLVLIKEFAFQMVHTVLLKTLMKFNKTLSSLITAAIFYPASLTAEESGIELLDPKLSQWEVWMGVPHTSVKDLPAGTPQNNDYNKGIPLGLGNDPKKVFSMIEEEGKPVLKITGEIYGGLTTLKEYENYHFSFEVKFGEKKWEPRLEKQRDSGLLYHCSGKHGKFWNVWMRSLEYQVQEKNLGDLFLLAGTAADVPTSPKEIKTPGVPDVIWDPAQPFKPCTGAERSVNHENPHGEWTHGEYFVLGQQAIHVVNGHVVLSLDKARLNDGTPQTRGKIQIQSEGAEVYYRNIKLRPITEFPAKYLAESKLPKASL